MGSPVSAVGYQLAIPGRQARVSGWWVGSLPDGANFREGTVSAVGYQLAIPGRQARVSGWWVGCDRMARTLGRTP